MADVANVTNDEPVTEVSDETSAAVQPDGQRPVGSPGVAPNPPQRRTWTMPKVPVSRKHADDLGRIALQVATSVASFIAGVARYGARVLAQSWRGIEAVPSALKLFLVVGLLALLGLAGSIALDNTLGLICTIVVIPVCSITLGALGNRWYSGVVNQHTTHTDTPVNEPAASELQRSVEYVDKKLAVALNSFGTERHQQAVIALFQAKTAVELTLGTEQDAESYGEVQLPAGDQSIRPRIQVGSSSKSLLRENSSLAAS